MIEGGYVILSRESSSILAGMTPCSRELYTYLLQKVNHTNGTTHKRGQGWFRLWEIRKDLAWMVGYREKQYTEDQMRTALKTLVKKGMIQGSKTTRGIHVTICHYDNLQDPKSYEARNETKVEYRTEEVIKPEPKTLLYQKEQKELRNNEERKKEIPPVLEEVSKISNEDYDLNVTTNEYVAKKGKYEEVQSSGRLEVQKQVSEVIEISKRWMPSQPESLRYLVATAIKNSGLELVRQATETYAINMEQAKYDNPITNARYWWSDGIYNHMNKSVVKTPDTIKAEKKDAPLKKKCNACHELQEFARDRVPSFCPLCNEGSLLSSMEYAVEFPTTPKKVEPVQAQVLTEEEEFHKNNVQNFMQAFGGKI